MDEINDKLVEMEEELNETVGNTGFIKMWAKARKLYTKKMRKKKKKHDKRQKPSPKRVY